MIPFTGHLISRPGQIWYLEIPTLQKPEIDETWIWKLKNQWNEYFVAANKNIFSGLTFPQSYKFV